jgi:hypothetical protein
MAESLVTRIWDDVTERVGDDLRVVTRYGPQEFETRMRDDVRAAYTDDEDREIVDDTIVKQLGLDDTETAFRTGRLHGVVRVFDDAWVLSWTDDLPKKSGVIVSIQRDGAAATMDDLDWCVRYLDDEIAPLVE